jgi:hypothetical protein
MGLMRYLFFLAAMGLQLLIEFFHGPSKAVSSRRKSVSYTLPWGSLGQFFREMGEKLATVPMP